MHRQTINGTEAIILQPRVAKVLASICSSDETRDNINRVWATRGRLYATDGCQAFRWCESADEPSALNGEETIAEANKAGTAVNAHREALQKAAKVADSKQAIALPLDGSPDLIVLDANASYLALRRDDDDDREAAVEAKVPRHGRHGESNDQAPEFDRFLLPPERANGRDGRLAGYDPTIQTMYLKTVHDLASALPNTKTTVHCRVRMPEPLNDLREVRGPACFELRESDTPGAMQFFIMPTRLPGAAIADGKPVGEIKTSGGICPSCGATLARELHSSCGCYTDVRPVETA